MAPVRVPVILPKAVTTTDTDEFSVKSAVGISTARLHQLSEQPENICSA